MKHQPRIVVGPDGRIALVNEQAQRMLGFVEEDLVGRCSGVLLHDDHRAQHVRARDEFLAEPSFDAGPLAPGKSALRTSAGRELFAWLRPEPLLRGDRLWLSLLLLEA